MTVEVAEDEAVEDWLVEIDEVPVVLADVDSVDDPVDEMVDVAVLL